MHDSSETSSHIGITSTLILTTVAWKLRSMRCGDLRHFKMVYGHFMIFLILIQNTFQLFGDELIIYYPTCWVISHEKNFKKGSGFFATCIRCMGRARPGRAMDTAETTGAKGDTWQLETSPGKNSLKHRDTPFLKFRTFCWMWCFYLIRINKI